VPSLTISYFFVLSGLGLFGWDRNRDRDKDRERDRDRNEDRDIDMNPTEI
jgi:hypothetical protein